MLLLFEFVLGEDALRAQLGKLLELFHRHCCGRGGGGTLLCLELLEPRVSHLVLLHAVLMPLPGVVGNSAHHRCAKQRSSSSHECGSFLWSGIDCLPCC